MEERIILLERTNWLWKIIAILWCLFFIPMGLLGLWSVFFWDSTVAQAAFPILFALLSSGLLIRFAWKTEILVATPKNLIIDRIFKTVKIPWEEIISFQRGPTVRGLKRVFVYTDANQTPFDPAGDIASVAITNENELIDQLEQLHNKYTGSVLQKDTALESRNEMTNFAANKIDQILR